VPVVEPIPLHATLESLLGRAHAIHLQPPHATEMHPNTAWARALEDDAEDHHLVRLGGHFIQ
jgi:hypothetical protein